MLLLFVRDMAAKSAISREGGIQGQESTRRVLDHVRLIEHPEKALLTGSVLSALTLGSLSLKAAAAVAKSLSAAEAICDLAVFLLSF